MCYGGTGYHCSSVCFPRSTRTPSCSEPSPALTFVLAPLPNALFSHCGSDEFAGSYDGASSGPVDLGRFITAMIVTSGFALPIVLAHAEVIRNAACVMSILGGGYVGHPAVHSTGLLYPALFMAQYWPTPLLSGRKSRNSTNTTVLIAGPYINIIGCTCAAAQREQVLQRAVAPKAAERHVCSAASSGSRLPVARTI